MLYEVLHTSLTLRVEIRSALCLGGFVIQAEWLADDLFGDLAAADALGTDENRPVGAVAGHMQPLQIRLELALGDAGDLGPDTAQVLGLATDGDLIAHLRAFAANFANPSHESLPWV